MDHRAIVWCHGVLDKVRQVIWTLMRCHEVDDNIQKRWDQIYRILGDENYDSDLVAMSETFQVCPCC